MPTSTPPETRIACAAMLDAETIHDLLREIPFDTQAALIGVEKPLAPRTTPYESGFADSYHKFYIKKLEWQLALQAKIRIMLADAILAEAAKPRDGEA